MACRAGYGARCGVRCRAMSGDYEDDVCRRALQLVQELCGHRQHHRQCLDFSDLLRHRGHPRHGDSGQLWGAMGDPIGAMGSYGGNGNPIGAMGTLWGQWEVLRHRGHPRHGDSGQLWGTL